MTVARELTNELLPPGSAMDTKLTNLSSNRAPDNASDPSVDHEIDETFSSHFDDSQPAEGVARLFRPLYRVYHKVRSDGYFEESDEVAAADVRV